MEASNNAYRMPEKDGDSPSPPGSNLHDREKEPIDGPVTPSARIDDNALALLNQIRTVDAGHPIHWPVWKKWVIISVYCLLQVFVTMTSTSYVSVEFLIQEKFGGTTQIVTLGQSMFIVGNAVGPAFLGPLS